MRLLILAIIPIILIAGCIDLGFQEAGVTLGSASAENQDISLNVESSIAAVKEGRNITLFFEVENKQFITLEDVNISIYDPCLFTGSDTFKSFGDLKENRTKTWSPKYESGNVNFETDCEIKFKTEYNRNLSVTQTIAVLEETEYYQREQLGTLGDISITFYSSESPLLISLSFSEDQPLIDGEDINMYIDYTSTGDGYVNTLQPSDIMINFPDNLLNVSCNGYKRVRGTFEMILDRELKFYNNEAPKTTCSFRTSASQPTDVKTLTMIGTYKYVLDNSILVKIRP